MFYIQTERGVKIAVYDLNPAGRKCLFLVHGWPLDHRMYEYQLNVLPKYDIRCVSIDLRGFGASSAPWGEYSYDEFAYDIYRVIRAMGLRDIYLCGFSMGGAIVIRYMARFREYRIKKLILVGAAAPSFIQREGYSYGITKEQLDQIISNLNADRPQAVVDFGKNFFYNPVSEPFRTWFNSINFDASGIGTIKSAESLGKEDLSNDLKEITVPCGIFHGRHDQVCPYEFALELEKGIKNSKLYTFEQSGDGVFYDEREKFNETLINFINE